MTDRERYQKAKAEARRFKNKYLSLKNNKTNKIELQAALAMIHDYCQEQEGCTGCYFDNNDYCELCEYKDRVITPDKWNMQRIIERMSNEGSR